MSERLTAVKNVVLLCVVLGVLTTAVGATVTIDTGTEYRGTESSTQAINATFTFSPDDSQVNDVTITIQETQRSFIDFDSFTVTTDPGTEEVNVTYQGNGQFSVPEVRPNEQITMEFDVYPRTIKERNLHVATVNVEYVQNGQNLADSQRIEADLSSSSYFALQNQRNWQLYAIVLGVAFVVALLLAVYFYSSRDDGSNTGGGSSGRQTR